MFTQRRLVTVDGLPDQPDDYDEDEDEEEEGDEDEDGEDDDDGAEKWYLRSRKAPVVTQIAHSS